MVKFLLMSLNPYFKSCLILIKGAGDLASGVAYRLKRSGFPLIMTELPAPVMVRRAVCFGEVVYSGETTVEGIQARRVETVEAALALAYSDIIPVLVDPETTLLKRVKPAVVVDAIMAKRNTGTTHRDAPLVIGLGPGFAVPQDCQAIVETNRGHHLGRVLYAGQAEADTGRPGPVKGHTSDRVLRAPAEGHVVAMVQIGDLLQAGDLIATINGHSIRAGFSGVLRGLIHPVVRVSLGQKIGDLDPRATVQHCFTISDKSLTIGGGVLEAILASDLVRPRQEERYAATPSVPHPTR
jgi:xanthine dehydrogenase accessory factor